jgi:hypothetical protein
MLLYFFEGGGEGGGKGNEDILHSTLNCGFRWTHTNFSIFHAIQVLTMIVKKMM